MITSTDPAPLTGQSITATAVLRPLEGEEPVNPARVTLTLVSPRPAVEVVEDDDPRVSKPDTDTYTLDFVPDLDGTWHVILDAFDANDRNVGAGYGSIYVQRRPVD